jgi:uncharacterized protein (TIGR03382 family)
MHSTRSLAATLFLGGALAWSASSQAALVLADNLSEAGDFYVSVSNDVWQAQAFTNTNATQLTAVELALYNDLGATGDFAVELWDLDAGAGTPGTSLNTLFSGSAASLGGAGTTLTISGLSIALTPSTSYYLVARGISLGGFDELNWLYADDTGGIGFPSAWSESADGGANWYAPSQTEPLKLRIEAATASVPVPATVPLLALGLLALVRRRRPEQAVGRMAPRKQARRRATGRPAALAAVSAVLVLFSLSTEARFRPKEYDLTLTTQYKNCESFQPAAGLCQGGNWAQIFAEGLSLTQCLSSTTRQPRLSSEELLQCTGVSFDRCATTPQDLDIVTAVSDYLLASGLTTDACLPYQQLGTFALTPACPSQCADGSGKAVAVKPTAISTLTGTTVIQDHIIARGPVVLAIRDTQSMNEYESGTYTPVNGEQVLGIRFLLLVGWSTTPTNEVLWKAVDSRGNRYGVNGRLSMSVLNPNILAYYGFQL